MSATKDFLTHLFDRAKNVTDILVIKRARAQKWQDATLKKLLYKAKNTAYGQEYDFDGILMHENTVEQFKLKVPIASYDVMHPWWQREYNGESDITWPGSPKYFALSSGTTQGASKFIPVTDAQLKSIFRASKRQLFAAAKSDVPKDFFTKHYLMIGGSTDLNYDGKKYSGDLSGISVANLPFWFDHFAVPTEEIKRERDWHLKVETMVNEAPNWDVAMIAGAPSWVKMLLEKIIERYELKNIHEIWPHLSVYTWGAISITPYKSQIEAMMGHPIHYIESYLCSEGFVAAQTKINASGMGLVFRNNTYFEFIPFNEENFDETGDVKPGAKALDLDEVVEGVNYAILISTCAGAWRYLIGDIIQFTNVDACEIKITGRTKQYLSLCGEHLSVENMNQGTELTGRDLDSPISEYCVRGLKLPNGEMGHRWYVSYPTGQVKPDTEQLRSILDQHLCVLNDDYATERQHVLKTMQMHVLPESDFMDFLESKGKLGGQSKFPRVMPEVMYQEWIHFLCDRYQTDTFV